MVLTPNETAEIGVIGGSGNYNLDILQDKKEIKVFTPYGNTSSLITLGTIGNRKVAFIARHAKNHVIPPHKINFRANLWAFKELGVKRIISPCACGSLNPLIKRGDFVVLDQLFDRTKARNETFFDGGLIAHLPFDEPFCPELRKSAIQALESLKLKYHTKGTYVCIEGPRFSTRAESEYYSKNGFDVVGMTVLTEAVLARELGICFCGIAMVTDSDAKGEEKVSVDIILKTMKENVENSYKLIEKMIPLIPLNSKCQCSEFVKTSLL